MLNEDLRKQVIAAIEYIAPEAADEDLEDRFNLQEQLDLDSVDVMNYIVKLGDDLNIDIPNEAYRSFLTIDGAVAYLKDQEISS